METARRTTSTSFLPEHRIGLWAGVRLPNGLSIELIGYHGGGSQTLRCRFQWNGRLGIQRNGSWFQLCMKSMHGSSRKGNPSSRRASTDSTCCPLPGARTSQSSSSRGRPRKGGGGPSRGRRPRTWCAFTTARSFLSDQTFWSPRTWCRSAATGSFLAEKSRKCRCSRTARIYRWCR